MVLGTLKLLFRGTWSLRVQGAQVHFTFFWGVSPQPSGVHLVQVMFDNCVIVGGCQNFGPFLGSLL